MEIWHPVCFRQDTVRDNPGNACSHQGSSPWVNPGDTTQVNGVSQDLGRQLSHRGFSTISDGKKLCEKGEAGRKTCTTAPSIKIQDITLSELFAPIRSAPLVDVWLWLNARLRMDWNPHIHTEILEKAPAGLELWKTFPDDNGWQKISERFNVSYPLPKLGKHLWSAREYTGVRLVSASKELGSKLLLHIYSSCLNSGLTSVK